MRYTFSAILFAAWATVSAPVACASIRSFVDIDRHDRYFSSCSAPFRWTLEIATVEGDTYAISGYPAGNGTWTDAGGFLVGVDELTSPGTGAYLDLWVRDDGDDPGHQAEKFRLNVDDFASGNQNATITFFQAQATASIRADIQADGKLQFTVTRQNGDFYLDYSALAVTANRPDPPEEPTSTTPEPASLVIWSVLGAGSWLGMRGRRRRRGGEQTFPGATIALPASEAPIDT